MFAVNTEQKHTANNRQQNSMKRMNRTRLILDLGRVCVEMEKYLSGNIGASRAGPVQGCVLFSANSALPT